MAKYLYHYTTSKWVASIIEDGFLKLTESNLKDLRKSNWDQVAYNQGTLKLYRPVVWMTDLDTPDSHNLGLISPVDKCEVKITIKKQQHFKKWLVWSRKNNINKEWALILEKGRKPKNWWISEIRVKMDLIEKIENLKTGEIYYERSKIE